MKFSVNWLKQWVAIDADASRLADELTAAGLEVDAVTPVAGPFSGVVVGEITACQTHPDADRLKVCTVNDGGDAPLQVVCGAPNARPGLKMPFARVGAVLGEDFKVGNAKLRGVASHGMCCSARELGLSEDHEGLMALPDDAPVGTDLREYLRLDDHAIDLELTPNRADCLGIKGLAREVAAILGADCTPVDIAPVPASIDDDITIALDDAADCPRYVGRVIRGIDPAATTPLWMREALRRCGIRSISAVVDATNYVLMELGQPMHAFDLNRLEGGIAVRRGRKGESLALLDEKVVELDDRLLAICDDTGPVALAGIMGGLDSGVTDSTTDILLESAWFRPSTIMGRARDLGLHTDASHRFERGVDPQGQVAAIERITALLLDIAGGHAGPVVESVAEDQLPIPQPVRLRLKRLNRVLGSDLAAAEVEDILERLDMRVTAVDGGWEAEAPSARFDIAIEEDLIEEVARIYGYDRLPAALPSGELQAPPISERRVPLTRLREVMCAGGYQEAITYAFVDQSLIDTLGMNDYVLPLANPISSDMNVMRTALLPGLLTALSRNQRRQQDRVRLFETGKVFQQGDTLEEIERVGAVACGGAWPEQWASPGRAVDFYDVKGDLEALLVLRGEAGEVAFDACDEPWLHPGQSATVTLDGHAAGWVGSIHPAMLSILDIKGSVFGFEVDLDPLLKREIINAKEISPYPSVRRDLAFVVPESINYREIRTLAEELAGDLLRRFVLFDQFSGQNVEKGYKSLAIGLILQDVSCTLTDEVVDSLIDRLVKGLESQLDAQLRG